MGQSSSKRNKTKTQVVENRNVEPDDMAQANTNINQQTQEEPSYHELEVCQHESDLHQRRNDCKKNKGHREFIPVDKFKRKHLPRGHRDPLCLDYIMAMISLTVRLVVNYVSCRRPDDYPLYQSRGQDKRSFGSGRVWWVERKFTDMDGKSCPCTQCEKLDDKDRTKQWGEFTVITAKHVVFDDEESRHTQVDVDYNTDTDRDTCPKLHGVEVEGSHMTLDECNMFVVSHDRDVCLMLEERVRRYNDLRYKLNNKYREYIESNNLPIVCVSHPHGMSKHVSVGEFRGAQKDRPWKWRYTTSTCPGSSGAPVHRLGWVVGGLGYTTHHSGCNRDHGDNESGRWGYSWL